MIVKCIGNLGKDLPSDCLTPALGYREDERDIEFNLIIDKYYVVYAMSLFGNYMWYAICENSTEYPVFKPSPFFSIKDNRISKYWVCLFRNEKVYYSSKFILAFSDWINNDYFYGNLLEGYEKEVKIFTEYKLKMDLEFPDPLILDTAEKIDDEWLLCQFCIDAWQPNSKDGMVMCPKCNRKLLNPLYTESRY